MKFYGIVLVHLTSNVAFKARKHFFRKLDIEFFSKLPKPEISPHSLSHCLTTFTSLDAKQNIVQLQFYSTATNPPVRCAFWGSDECGASMPNYSFRFFLQVHIKAFNFPQPTLLAFYLKN